MREWNVKISSESITAGSETSPSPVPTMELFQSASSHSKLGTILEIGQGSNSDIRNITRLRQSVLGYKSMTEGSFIFPLELPFLALRGLKVNFWKLSSEIWTETKSL